VIGERARHPTQELARLERLEEEVVGASGPAHLAEGTIG
jgi:hypothetical protein